jgi:hypothetical protein
MPYHGDDRASAMKPLAALLKSCSCKQVSNYEGRLSQDGRQLVLGSASLDGKDHPCFEKADCPPEAQPAPITAARAIDMLVVANSVQPFVPKSSWSAELSCSAGR